MCGRIIIYLATVTLLAACDPSVTVPGGSGSNGSETGGSGTGAGGTGAGAGGSSTSTSGDGGMIPSDCDGCYMLGTKLHPNPCPGAQELFDGMIDCICSHCAEECGAGCQGMPTQGVCAPCVAIYCDELAKTCAGDKRFDDS